MWARHFLLLPCLGVQTSGVHGRKLFSVLGAVVEPVLVFAQAGRGLCVLPPQAIVGSLSDESQKNILRSYVRTSPQTLPLVTCVV